MTDYALKIRLYPNNEEIYQLDAIQLTFKLMDYINYEDKDLD